MSETVTAPAEVTSPASSAAPAPAIDTSALADLGLSAAEVAAATDALTNTKEKPVDPYDVGGAGPAFEIKKRVEIKVPEVEKHGEVSAAEKPAETEKPGDEDPVPEKLGKFRVQAKDFKEAELLRHMKSMSAEEAYAKVYGAPAAKAAPSEAVDAPTRDVAKQDADPVAALRAEIAVLEADSDKAADDMDTKTANRLNRQILAKEAEVRQLEASYKAAQVAKANEAENTFQQKTTEAAKEVYKLRPSLADKASADRGEFDAFTNLKFSDPDYKAIFDSPRWPAILYREFAEAKGWNKAAAPASAPAMPAPTPGASSAPRVTAATVLTPGETPGGVSFNPAQFLADLDKMDVSQLRSLLPR